MSPLGQITRRSTFPPSITHLLSPIPDICHAHHQTTILPIQHRRGFGHFLVSTPLLLDCSDLPFQSTSFGKIKSWIHSQALLVSQKPPRDQRPMASPLRIVGFLFRLHPLPLLPFFPHSKEKGRRDQTKDGRDRGVNSDAE